MSVSASEKPGSHRLLLKKDTHQIGLILGRLQEASTCKTVLLIDEAGHLISKKGKNPTKKEATYIALLAGTFQTTRRLSRLLSSQEFSSRVNCGKHGDLMMLQVGEEALLAVTLGEDATATMVRTYALEAIRRLEEVFKRASKRSQEKAIKESGWKGNNQFADAVGARLDALFG